MRKIKLLSLFSGIGAFETALDRMNIEYELVNFCEIDKYAAKSYCAVHGTDESKNLGDITKVDTSLLPNDIDLITYGFPCQDISLSGLQKGFEYNGERTRSGLFFEALRIIEDTKPRVAIAENVKNLVSKKFAKEFEIVLSSLENAGYNNYWQVLNSKNYGIPQNRERVFIVSIRKDLDDGNFKFGEPFPLEFRLKDMLEEKVDEKYYLSDETISKIKYSNFNQEKKRILDDDVSSTLLARDYKDPKCVKVDNDYVTRKYDEFIEKKGYIPEVFNPYHESEVKDVANTITGNCSSKTSSATHLIKETKIEKKNKQCIYIKEKTKKGYAEAHDGDGVYLNRPHQKRGCVQENMIQTIKTNGDDVGVVVKGAYARNFGSKGKIEDSNGISHTLVSAMGAGGGNVPLTAEIINVGNTKSGGERSAIISSKGICKCLTATDYKQPVQIQEDE